MRRVKCQEQIRFKEKSSHSSIIPQLTRMGGPWNSGPVVLTSLGKVEGSLFKSENGNKIYSYRGIPYGAPPLGARRIKKPEPVSSRKNISMGAPGRGVQLRAGWRAEVAHQWFGKVFGSFGLRERFSGFGAAQNGSGARNCAVWAPGGVRGPIWRAFVFKHFEGGFGTV